MDNERRLYAAVVAIAAKKVRKGEVRNTVLRQVKALRASLKQLAQGASIKREEERLYREQNPEKAGKLRRQIEIIETGSDHIQKAIHILQEYRQVTVT